jgi:predicted membrane-bound spermidine synthase
MEFPLAAHILAHDSGQIARSAGKVYALDLLGACAGGIVTSVFFIPVLGIVQTIWFLVILKISGIILIYLFYHPGGQQK